MEYTAELDGINGYGTFFYSVFSEEEYDLVEMWVILLIDKIDLLIIQQVD